MKHINRLLFWVETVLILVPITAMLFLLGFPFAVGQLLDNPGQSSIVIAFITLLASVATVSVWTVLLRSIKGIAVLDRRSVLCWILIIAGLIISVSAMIIPRLIIIEPYSEDWWFYDQLTTFALGLPLLAPALHALAMGLTKVRAK